MSKSFATALGMSSLMLLAVLAVNDVQSLFGSPGFPRVITSLMICMIAILANAYFTYRIVRGAKPEPSYSKDELRDIVIDAARTVMREEMETVAGKIFIRELSAAGLADQAPNRPAPKPHLVRTNEN